MPYYYGGYGTFLANNVYFLLLIPAVILSLWAQAQVSGNFSKYSKVSNRRRLTGAQAAEAVLRAHGAYGVAITSTWGKLTDHYDPRDNTIYLSQDVYAASTVAAAWRPMRRATRSSTPWATPPSACGAPLCRLQTWVPAVP